MTTATFSRSNGEIEAIKAAIASAAVRRANELSCTLHQAKEDGSVNDLPATGAFTWTERGVTSGQADGAVAATAWWLAGNGFNTHWTLNPHEDIWELERLVQQNHAGLREFARQIVAQALEPVREAMAHETATGRRGALSRWRRYRSPRFQEELRRLDEAAMWGRAPKRGTDKWQERVARMLED